MRLICPSCGAQYEVSPDSIPAAGRDVQCSACQHVWFEKGHPPPPPRLLNPQPWEEAPQVDDDEEEADDLADLRMDPLPEAQPRQRMDPEVSRILREEADRESRARSEEVARRSVADVAPEDPVDRAVAELAREDAAHRAAAPLRQEPIPVAPVGAAKPAFPLPQESPSAPVAAPQRPAQRVERSLDVDRINANLRIQADRLGAKAPQIEAPQRSGGSFGRGFLSTLIVLALLAALYVFRTEIEEAVPQSAGLLDRYAEMVDAGRLWLDRQVASLRGVDAPAALSE